MKSPVEVPRPASWKLAGEILLHLLAALAVFSLILLNRSPNLLRPIGISLRACGPCLPSP
jgi:hypothetical protein